LAMQNSYVKIKSDGTGAITIAPVLSNVSGD
jgi:hypothetical protein